MDKEHHRMNDVVNINSSTELTNFRPEETVIRNSALNGKREAAQRLRDWESLEGAVDDQIAEQTAFVAWWDGAVSVNQSPGRGNKSITGLLSISAEEAENETSISPMQVSRWRKRLSDIESYKALLYGSAYKKAMDTVAKHNHRAQGTGVDEWYTPSEWIERARQVMGGIDLDPASSVAANGVVRATEFFTEQQDGISRNWHGRVWLNPPYSQPLISNFAEKMVSEWKAQRCESAIVLTHNYTDTRWFHCLAAASAAVYFTRGRIGFVNQRGERASPTQGQAFFYFGEDVDIFSDVFGETEVVFLPGASHADI